MERECAKALKKAGSEGELSMLRKNALKRSTESMAIVKWVMQESTNQRNAATAYSAEQRAEKLRLLKESLAKEDDNIRDNGGKVGINARLIFLEKLKNWILGIIAILATDFARRLLHSLFFVARKIDENRPVS